MVEVCKDCKYWDRREDDWGACDLTASEGGPEVKTTKAYAVNMYNYYGHLLTRENFGCNQFEAKDKDK